MDERESWLLLGIVGLLAVASILHSRWLGTVSDAVIEHRNDIEFLKSALRAMDERVD